MVSALAERPNSLGNIADMYAAHLYAAALSAAFAESSAENTEKWDSLQHMNLMLALEEEFKIKFTDEEIVRMITAGIILEVLEAKA